MPTTEKGRNWKVRDQVFTTDVTRGGFKDVVEVEIETESGIRIPLKLPFSDYAPEVIERMGNAAVDDIEDVQHL